jgi:hypothetical protein
VISLYALGDFALGVFDAVVEFALGGDFALYALGDGFSFDGLGGDFAVDVS